MKKNINLLLVFLLVLGLVACGTSEKVATGVAKGFKGDVTVEVAYKDHEITKVTVKSHSETEGIGSKAVEKIPGRIVEKQSVDVDVLATATYTSKAIMEATKKALESVKFDFNSLKPKNDATSDKKEENLEADVVVVGAGGAGMVAAIELANRGHKVVILEKNELTGGNSVKATGGMNAADTKYQDKNKFNEKAGVEKTIKTACEKYPELKELTDKVEKQFGEYLLKSNNEYFDSAELFMLDTLIGGKNLNNHKLVEVLAKESNAAVEWLGKIGINLTDAGFAGGASVKRIHRPVNEEGKALAVGSYMVPLLTKNIESNSSIKILYGAPATELLVDNGQVVGVKAKGYTVKAKAVILTTGGFGYNLDMVAKYKPELTGFISTNAPGITGDGITMAEKVGAKLVDMEQIQIHPTVYKENASLVTEGLRGDGAILVNQEGKRFIDETSTRDVVSAAEIKQTGSYAYLIIDQKMVDASLVIQGYIKKDMTKKGDTIADLAKVLEIDAKALEDTLNKWNSYVKARKDSDFNRTSFTEPLDKGPFYAIKVTPGIHHTMGGLAINEKAEVLKADNTPIKGLYAAGEVTGGVHGANRLGGNAVVDFVVYGLISARSASEFVK